MVTVGKLLTYLGNLCYLHAFIQVDQLDTGSNPAQCGNILNTQLNDNSLCGDHHDLVIVIHSLGAYHITGLFYDLVAFHALTATFLYGKFIHIGPFTHTVFGYDQQVAALSL